MKKKFTILGCGSSLATPWITGHWGACNKNNIRNIRTRCCAHIQYNDISILIDTSPDIKTQLQIAKIKNLDSVLYTHEHADQTSGIFELRPFFWMNKKKIPIYGSRRTIKELREKYSYCFVPKHGYKPIMTTKIIKNKLSIKKLNSVINIKSFEVNHGLINATGYSFNGICYISDCNNIPDKSLKYLKNLKVLIIDCLREKKHPSHFNLDDALDLVKKTKPEKTILTNLHVDLDYIKLKKKLPPKVIPAYDGLSFNF